MSTAARNRRSIDSPLSARARMLARLVFIVPLVAFLVIAGVRVVRLFQAINRDLGPLVASVLHESLGHEFIIGRIRNTPGAVRIDDVAVSSKPTWKESRGQAGLRVRQVVIRYNFAGLMKDVSNASHYIESITLDHPTALVERYTQKRFNFTDLIKTKKRKNAKPFVARIEVVEGTLYFRDYMAPADEHGQPPVNVAYRVNGEVDCDSNELITFSGSGLGRTRFASVYADGQISRRQPIQYNVDASVTNGDAAYWTHYLRLVPQAQVLAGRGNVQFSILVPPARQLANGTAVPAPLVVLGSGSVHDGAVRWLDRRFLDAPIENVAGNFSFSSTQASMNGVASVEGQRINIAGSVGFTPASTSTVTGPKGSTVRVQSAPATLALRLSSRAFNVARLATAFPKIKIPAGFEFAPAAASLDLSGPATDPVVRGGAADSTVTYRGNRITGLRGNVMYAHRLLGVSNAAFAVNGTGQGIVNASVDLSGPTLSYTASGHLAGVNLASLTLPSIGRSAMTRSIVSRPSVAGLMSADFIAQDSGARLRITSNVDVSRGQVARTPLQSLRGRVVWNSNQSVELDKVAVDTAGGTALVSGRVGLAGAMPSLNLSVSAAGIRLKDAIGPYTSVDAAGIAYYNGVISGPLDSPTATGTVDLFRARYGRFDADIVRGDLTASRSAVKLYDLHIDRYPAEVNVAGSINGLSANARLALKASIRGGQLDDLTQLLGQSGRERAAKLLPAGASPSRVASALQGVAGEFDGDFDIGGTVREPSLSGKVQLKNVTAGGNHIDTAQALVSATDRQIFLQRVVLRSGKATASGDLAWWPHTGKIQAVVAGSDVELYRFRSFYGPYADLRGSFNFSGSLAGTISQPTVTFGIVASDISVDGQHLADFIGFGRYANGTLSSDYGPWDFTLLVPNPADGSQAARQITYSIDTFQLKLPQNGAGRAASPRLTMTAHIPAEAPESLTHVIDTLRGSKFAALPAVQRVVKGYDGLPHPTDAVISVPKVTIDGPLSALHVAGTIAIRNAVSGQNHVGAVDLTVDYNALTQTATGSMTSSDLLVNGIPLTSLNIEGASYAKRVMEVQSIRAEYGDGFVEASGRADLDGTMTADLDASNIPLSMFDALMPRSRALLGSIGTLTARASGPTRSPDIQGSITVSNPEIAYRTVVAKGGKSIQETVSAYKLDEIRAESIAVTSPKPGGSQILSIDNLAAYHNGKPIASLNGSVPFRWSNIDQTLAQLPTDQPLNAKLVVNDLSILAFASPLIDPARTSGVLTATINANDPHQAAPFGGSVTIANASIGFVQPSAAEALSGTAAGSTIDTYLKNINGVITFDQTHAVIDTFTGISSVKGGFALTGTSSFRGPSNLNLRLALNAFQINEHTRQSLLSRLYDSSAQGKINGVLSITGPFRTPLLKTAQGAPITITDASMNLPSAPSTSGGPRPVYPVDPRFDLHFAIGTERKPVNVKKTVLNADVYGVADVTRTLSDPGFNAFLSITGGRVALLGPVLRIQPGGTVALTYPVRNPDDPNGPPIMAEDASNVVATTTVAASLGEVSQFASSSVANEIGAAATASATSTVDAQRTEYHITLTLNGPLSNLNIDPTSEPYLDRSQIFALLTQQGTLVGILHGGAGSGEQVAQELGSVINSVGVGMLLNPVETNIAQALGLSSFAVDYAPDAPVNVSLTAPLGRKFELSLMRSFGPRIPGTVNSLVMDPLYQVKLSYKITNLLRISVSRDDVENNTLSLEGVIYLDRPPRKPQSK